MRSLILFFMSLLLLGCRKEVPAVVALPFAATDLKAGCLNRMIGKNPGSEYQKLVWNDEFEGPARGESAGCYTMKPTCSQQLEFFGQNECPKDLNESLIQNLNKCKWTLWSGYSFWSPKKTLRYHPNQVSVTEGFLHLKLKRSHEKSSFLCGPNAAKDSKAIDYNDLDCPYVSGGVDSKTRTNATIGRDFQNGRVEVRAKIPASLGGYAAIWTWPVDLNSGSPYLAKSWMPPGEHDLLEANRRDDGRVFGFQTFHDYTTTPGSGGTGRGSKSKFFELNPDQFYTFGVERFENELRFYVDNCYTDQIQQGAQGLNLNDFPNFVMMNYGMIPETNFLPSGSAQNAELLIDWVRFYEK